VLEFAKVFAIHPEESKVDCELHNGRKLYGVRVLQSTAGHNSGSINLPSMDDKNEIRAVIGFVSNEPPVVLGFIVPEIAQWLFKDNKAVNKHHSGVYTTIGEDGNVELFHPSGAFMRMAEDSEHEDLAGKDYDKKWKDDKNADKDILITVGFKTNTVKIVMSAKDKLITVTGDMDITGNVKITGDVDIVGKVTTSDDVTVGGKVQATGDVIAGTISLEHHLHGNGNMGSPTTEPIG